MQAMLKEGTYAACFKTPAGEGRGVAHLENGNITGDDDILTTLAPPETDGDRFTAMIRMKIIARLRIARSKPTWVPIDRLVGCSSCSFFVEAVLGLVRTCKQYETK
jgi:hypothetical protein